jgi:hypothetical protein
MTTLFPSGCPLRPQDAVRINYKVIRQGFQALEAVVVWQYSILNTASSRDVFARVWTLLLRETAEDRWEKKIT